MPSPSSALSGVTLQLHRLATLWKRAAIEFAEQELALAKANLFDCAAGPADLAAIRRHEKYLVYLRQLEGQSLEHEFGEWRREHPELASAMIRAIAARDRNQLRALAEARP